MQYNARAAGYGQAAGGRVDMGRDEQRDDSYAAAETALDDGDTARVLGLLEPWTRERPPDAAACALVGLAYFYDGEYERARPLLETALGADPNDPEARAALGACFFYAREWERAERAFREALDVEPHYGLAHYWLARALDWRAAADPGRAGEAERHFALAAREDAEAFAPPVPIADDEFDRILNEAIAGLPAPVRDALREVTIAVDRYPDEAMLDAFGDDLEIDLLGLYTGVALPERTHMDSGRLPDVIHVFKRNLEIYCRQRDELVREIRDTLLHEVGHYLGLDEEELDELGL